MARSGSKAVGAVPAGDGGAVVGGVVVVVGMAASSPAVTGRMPVSGRQGRERRRGIGGEHHIAGGGAAGQHHRADHQHPLQPWPPHGPSHFAWPSSARPVRPRPAVKLLRGVMNVTGATRSRVSGPTLAPCSPRRCSACDPVPARTCAGPRTAGWCASTTPTPTRTRPGPSKRPTRPPCVRSWWPTRRWSARPRLSAPADDGPAGAARRRASWSPATTISTTSSTTWAPRPTSRSARPERAGCRL